MSILRSIEAVLDNLPATPPRLVSLVPSYTESLIDLGFGKNLIGITDYCIRPEPVVKQIPRVGGVYNPRIEEIVALAPDLVIANQEENRPETIDALVKAGLNIWLTFPQSVVEMFDVLVGIVALYHDPAASVRVRSLESAFEWASQAALELDRVPVFVPIWQDASSSGELYWMTFNRQTYSSDLLDRLGGSNVFAGRTRRYPLAADLGLAPAELAGERDVRYPRVTLAEVIAAQPLVILLPDEPFDFKPAAVAEITRLLQDTPAVRAGRVYSIDGSMLAWCGTRIGKALDELPGYLTI